jgi:uncharacterized protein YyaL (SSP411 family)
VHWQPWDEAALAAARTADKPILLSIGYSACHWCHVMAHESFEDAATAALMNEHFVCIKLDREERPDLDKVYQLAHQALTRRNGGWPLTVFLAPDDHLPFFAGTYFPKQRRYGMPAFAEVLDGVATWWRERRGEVRQQNQALAGFLNDYGRADDHAAIALDDLVATTWARWQRSFDPTHGGFGGAPKFPHTGELRLLLDLAQVDGDARQPEARRMVVTTLTAMARGGIYDQVGGGFARYSVDAEWAIPHFEKMLYDNALLLPLYAEAAARGLGDDHARVARETVDWLVREMAAPGGGWYAALDADSEGEEGLYYVWDVEAIAGFDDLLGADAAALIRTYYGFDRSPNFEGKAWNPILSEDIDELARRFHRPPDAVVATLAAARTILAKVRDGRVRPGTDDKVLTAWNALLVSGLARTARALGDLRCAELAIATQRYLQDRAFRDGRLYASLGGGLARFPAYLDDHALLLEASLDALQLVFSAETLATATRLADSLLERFEDRSDAGGFWFTAHDHDTQIARLKPWFDEALPGGNGIAARALLRLGHLLGESRYLDAAERTLAAARRHIGEAPQAAATLLDAHRRANDPPAQVLLHTRDATTPPEWQVRVADLARRGIEVYPLPFDAAGLDAWPVLAAQRATAQRSGAAVVAFVCRGTACSAPMTEASTLP